MKYFVKATEYSALENNLERGYFETTKRSRKVRPGDELYLVTTATCRPQGILKGIATKVDNNVKGVTHPTGRPAVSRIDFKDGRILTDPVEIKFITDRARARGRGGSESFTELNEQDYSWLLT